jgi:hypothetical protein
MKENKKLHQRRRRLSQLKGQTIHERHDILSKYVINAQHIGACKIEQYVVAS